MSLPRLAAALLVLPSVAAAQEELGPEPVRGLVSRAEGAFEGYTLLAPLRSTTTYLIDMDGRPVHRWESDAPPGNAAYLLENGNLLRAARVDDNPVFSGGGQGGRVQEMTWDGTVVWDYRFSSEEHLHHHDLARLPNGNVLLLAWERVTSEEAFEAGRDPALLGEDVVMWPDFVVEVRPEGRTGGEIVWEWHVWDHLIQDFNPHRANHGVVAEHPERIDVNADVRRRQPTPEEAEAERRRLEELGYAGAPPAADGGDGDGDDGDHAAAERRRRDGDWNHTNAIAYHPGLDQIALSVRRFSEIWIIDHSTTTEEAAGSTGGRHGRGGDLLYRWGNPQIWQAGDEEDRQLYYQHDVHWIAPGLPGEGNLLLFNNGGRAEGERRWSTVDEIAPPLDAEGRYTREPGAAYGPEAPTWTYAAPIPGEFYSSYISGAQRMPNGNTLICSGEQGRLFEVTPAGEIVWDYLNPYHDAGLAERPGRPPGGEAGGR